MTVPRSGLSARLLDWAGRHPWQLAFGLAVLALTLQRLSSLDSVPLPQYNDEASIGYNAWAVATTGADAHGNGWPLYFQAFDDYSQSPLYLYLLAPLTRVFGLTPAVERLPAALSGIGACLLLALAAWRITRSRPVALLVLLTAAVEPWLVVENRVGFDVNALVLCVAATIWAVAHAVERGGRGRWFAAAGVFIGLSVYAYETGRLFGLLLWVALALAFGIPRRSLRRWWLAMPPVAAAYGLLLAWSSLHPGALTQRFDVVGILADHPSALTVLRRFAGNYIQYWSPSFLATHGDGNLRHNTGFGGQLLIVALPAVLLGIAVCVRRRREPLPRFTLLGLLLAPVPAALTMDGTPHSLRAAVMLPFLLLASVYGWERLLTVLRTRRAAAVLLTVLAVVEVGGFFVDLYHYWPQRSALWFEAGLGPAIVEAHQAAGGDHTVVVSNRFEAAGALVDFWLQPDPRSDPADAQQVLGVRVGDVATAKPGDIMVLGPYDTAPQGATLLDQQTVTVDQPTDQVGRPSTSTQVLASVWRR